MRADVDFKREPWPKVSQNAKDLVKRMLDPNPNTRFTAQQVLGNAYSISFSLQIVYLTYLGAVLKLPPIF